MAGKKTDSEEMRKLLTEMSMVNNNYVLQDLEELNEYMWLKPNITGLNVDIFIDDGSSYKRNGHPLLLFARNGYNKTDRQFIPFSIEMKPRVMDDEMEFKISYDDVFSIQDFIQLNCGLLIKMADEKISHTDFINSIFRITNIGLKMVDESKSVINEMATLRKSESLLPMDIWLDEGSTFQGHAPRLKFRASNEQITTREFSSMILGNPPSIENFPQNSPLRKRDIEKLQRFVLINLELLLKLANGEIDYTTEFLPNMAKVQ